MFKSIYKLFHRHYRLKYHDVYRHAKKLFIFDLALLGLATLMFSSGLFFFFWKPGIADYVDLSISLGDERIKSGQPVRLSIEYTNRSKFNLKSAVLSVHLPPGFVVDRSRTLVSEFSDNSTIDLGELKPGAKGRSEIAGWYWSIPNQEEKIAAFFSFSVEEKKRPEMKSAIFLASLPESSLKGELVVATTTLPGGSIPFTYTLTNMNDRALADIFLAYSWGQDGSTALLRPLTLSAMETKTITGTVPMAAEDEAVDVIITPQVKVNNRLLRQESSSRRVRVYRPVAECSIKFAGDAPYAENGQALQIATRIKNEGSMPLRNIKMKLRAQPDGIIDWRETARLNRGQVEDNQFSLDRMSRTAFAKLNAAEEEKFNLRLQLLPRFTALEIEKARLTIEAVAEAGITEASRELWRFACEADSLPLATEVLFNSEVRYYTDEGDQLGRGPLPPRVDRATKYWIFTKITNTFNPLQDIEFSTALPADVEFTGKQSVTIGEEIKFNPASRKVTWKSPSLPPNSQTGLFFEVAITPEVSQIGQELRLTETMSLNAKDELTGKRFNLVQAGLKNVLPTIDEGARFGAKVNHPTLKGGALLKE